MKARAGTPNEQKAQVYMMQAIKRLGIPADIAGPVAFLTSEDRVSSPVRRLWSMVA
jgi:NAD(P)-dependent dehydrogenase (short-subunit alcohol dehydrogenase family)